MWVVRASYKAIFRIELACLRKADYVTRQWEWEADGDHEIQRGEQCRQREWTESLAVGGREFVKRMGDVPGTGPWSASATRFTFCGSWACLMATISAPKL